MREIKFRAWDENFEQMVGWEELKFDKDPGDKRICFYEQEDGSDSVWNGGAYYTIMQYTGLKDKNGKEIYEGDVVDCLTSGLSVVKFNRGSFVLENKEIEISFYECCGLMEVIGNIFQNGELLNDSELPKTN